jgi:hypothetical protein
MLWMGLWVHPYAVPLHVQVGVNFRTEGVWPSLYHIYIVVSWLRLQTPIDCIPITYWMYTKCFSTLRLWMGIWVHPYAVLHVQEGVSFRKIGVWQSLYDVVVSW